MFFATCEPYRLCGYRNLGFREVGNLVAMARRTNCKLWCVPLMKQKYVPCKEFGIKLIQRCAPISFWLVFQHQTETMWKVWMMMVMSMEMMQTSLWPANGWKTMKSCGYTFWAVSHISWSVLALRLSVMLKTSIQRIEPLPCVNAHGMLDHGFPRHVESNMAQRVADLPTRYLPPGNVKMVFLEFKQSVPNVVEV